MNSSTQEIQRRKESAPERVKPRAAVAPPVDVYENADEIVIVADVPGARAESVNVVLDKGELTLEAERADEGQGAALLREQRTADYRRVFSIPETIDATRIEARLTAGVLHVRLPKSEVTKARRIQVKAG